MTAIMLPDNPEVLPVFRWLLLTTGDIDAANALFWRGYHSTESQLASVRNAERQTDMLAVGCRLLLDTWQPEKPPEKPIAEEVPPLLAALPGIEPSQRAVIGWYVMSLEKPGSFRNPFGETPAATADLLLQGREALAEGVEGVTAPGPPPPGTEPDLQWVPSIDSPENRKVFADAWEDLDQDPKLRDWFRQRALFDYELEKAATSIPPREPDPGAAIPETRHAPPGRRTHRLLGILSVVGAILLLLLVLGAVFFERARSFESAEQVAALIAAGFAAPEEAFTSTDGTVAELTDLLFLRVGAYEEGVDPGLLDKRVQAYRFFEIEEHPVVDVVLEDGVTHLFLFNANELDIEDEAASKNWQVLDANDMVFGLRIREDLGHLVVRPGSRKTLTNFVVSLRG